MTNSQQTQQVLGQFDSQHEDMVHDAQMDFYGKRLATASSDRSVRIHSISGGQNGQEQYQLIATLKGHEGPVWAVDWSHPKYGSLLASCAYDGKVLVWKEEHGQWTQIYAHNLHSASVNSVAWAPYEYGLLLACGSSDGKVSIVQWREDTAQWSVQAEFVAHQIGCNALSWAPSAVPGTLVQTSGGQQSQPQQQMKRLVTGGSDNLVKIWRCDPDGKWQTAAPEAVLEGHSDWVRDVAWAPNLGLPISYIASCSQDRTVLIWSLDSQQPQAKWQSRPLRADGEEFSEPLWRVSWSTSGHLLAVSGGDNKVTLWKQNLKGEWELMSELADNAQ